jgi:hypothetical protein
LVQYVVRKRDIVMTVAGESFIVAETTAAAISSIIHGRR